MYVWLICHSSNRSKCLHRFILQPLWKFAIISIEVLVGLLLFVWWWCCHRHHCCYCYCDQGIGQEDLTYKDLIVELSHMQNVITEVKPLITGAAGTMSVWLRKYQNNVPGKHDIKKLQKISMLGTMQILWKLIMLQYKTFIMGNNVTCAVYFNRRICDALYTLGIWFGPGI